MSFPWLDPTPARSGGADRRLEVARAELAHRAGLLFRLGYTADAATARLRQRIAWEHEGTRPDGLSDAEIAQLVTETFARRPG